ncbi:formin-like protein 5 [Dermochelys coriacea]|uniref:formin-like protein 5 n=1 Tax=Dermochelys coriacea TaxID=27794 RepID=UPI0018E6EAA1|nr:formin-like protein 5 [Dermochelys coriacea]
MSVSRETKTSISARRGSCDGTRAGQLLRSLRRPERAGLARLRREKVCGRRRLHAARELRPRGGQRALTLLPDGHGAPPQPPPPRARSRRDPGRSARAGRARPPPSPTLRGARTGSQSPTARDRAAAGRPALRPVPSEPFPALAGGTRRDRTPERSRAGTGQPPRSSGGRRRRRLRARRPPGQKGPETPARRGLLSRARSRPAPPRSAGNSKLSSQNGGLEAVETLAAAT